MDRGTGADLVDIEELETQLGERGEGSEGERHPLTQGGERRADR